MNITNVIKNPRSYLLLANKRMMNFFRAKLFRGEKVYCEICNWRGRSFFNEICPNCNSVPRIRLIPLSVKHFGLLKERLSILHVAPNINEFNYIKENFKNMNCYNRLDIKQRKHTNIKESITEIDTDRSSYDLVIVWHVFEHVKDDMKAISNIHRVLNPNGKLLVSVPIYPKGNKKTYEDPEIKNKDYSRIHGHYDHCRSCGLDYYKRFETIGFNTETLLVSSFDHDKIKFNGLRSDHVVWCFTK